MSLFSSLNVATRALHASQTAIDITGQNIANANTEGYSRKRVNLEPDSRHDNAFGEIGMGVDVVGITRIRDAFIDQQVYEQLGDKGMLATLDDAMERLENLFQEPSDVGLNATLSGFFDSWQDLANNPGDLSAREAVKASAVRVIDLLNSLSIDMGRYRTNMDDLLGKKVTEANDLMRRIDALNTEIATVEARPGQVAADTRDMRDLAVRRLSEILDVRAIEDEQGRVSISTGGTLLVGPSRWNKLEVFGTTRVDANGSEVPTIGVRLADGKRVLEPNGGVIKGILEVKDNLVPAYQNNLDMLAKSLVKEVNDIHRTGFTLSQHNGIEFFDPNSTTALTIRLSDGVKNDSKNIAAASGQTTVPVSETPPAGIPDPLVSPTLDLTTLNPQYRYLTDGTLRVTLNGTGEVLREGAGEDYIVDYVRGTVTFLNYAKFAAGDSVTLDFRHSQTAFPGNGDGSNALTIARLRQRSVMAPDPLGNATQSLSSFYNSFVGALGIGRNQIRDEAEAKEFLIAQMDAEQASISGVSMDEEMINLVKYQHSYQAAARIISTVNQMLDVLMNI
jgi:flagellar hook-associated protein 1 FlgK